MVYGFVDFSKCLDGSDGRPRNLIRDDDKFDKRLSEAANSTLRPTSVRLTDPRLPELSRMLYLAGVAVNKYLAKSRYILVLSGGACGSCQSVISCAAKQEDIPAALSAHSSRFALVVVSSRRHRISQDRRPWPRLRQGVVCFLRWRALIFPLPDA